ncbi:MAG: glycoside hydrolase family 92 protein, partial [Bacteroidales bacterium]|nr:glycoside hydrolase family 92 protein [Bacteroidales bacterium]
AQLGFYPLEIGTPSYELFSPIFDRITFNYGGKKVKIKTIGRKDYSDPVKEISVDGKPVEGCRLDHEAFKKGSTIVFKY